MLQQQEQTTDGQAEKNTAPTSDQEKEVNNTTMEW